MDLVKRWGSPNKFIHSNNNVKRQIKLQITLIIICLLLKKTLMYLRSYSKTIYCSFILHSIKTNLNTTKTDQHLYQVFWLIYILINKKLRKWSLKSLYFLSCVRLKSEFISICMKDEQVKKINIKTIQKKILDKMHVSKINQLS